VCLLSPLYLYGRKGDLHPCLVNGAGV
jgi:hypothetical protein